MVGVTGRRATGTAMTAFPPSDIIAAVLAELPEARAIYLFGSHADGSAGAESDLDLAVLLPGRGDPVRVWQAGEGVAHRLNVDVDLVDLGAASTVMQFQVLTTGRRLFAADGQVDRFEAFVMAEMIDLNHARAGLLADITREGRVHGR